MDKNHYLAGAMGRRNRHRGLTVAIHAIAWGLMFGFPLLFSQGSGRSVDWVWYAGYCMVPLSFMLVFYVNYFGLIGRLLFRRRVVGFVAVNAVLITVVVLLMHLWFDFYRTTVEGQAPPPDDHGPRLPLAVFMLRDVLLLGLTAALSVAIRVTGNWYDTEAERRQAEQARTQAELQNLKSQLNPHFLFNTLNNIYALIAIGPERAQEAVLQLSGLLRHVLYEKNQDLVPLEKELAFVRSYVELMSLRLPGTVKLRVDIPGEEADSARGICVAPLLFITLIENAFKHGVSADAPSFVDISLKVMGDKGDVVCRIANSYFPKRDNDRSGSGIGLENLRRRLGLIYPGRYALRTEREGDTFVAEMTVNCIT